MLGALVWFAAISSGMETETEGLPYKQDGGVPRTFKGLKSRFGTSQGVPFNLKRSTVGGGGGVWLWYLLMRVLSQK